ncbi:hypothetical protein ANN_07815 [Periplaneta americana]|uniref:Major facilitator superfamily (MFS) profile domain-containing protein n=1 Tax=Periplaneta americana TaxID=6978 RepID=A0ABQ8T192_PERAM|nr:hypothetical protein ANN_07815 [Periplaneta americana]
MGMWLHNFIISEFENGGKTESSEVNFEEAVALTGQGKFHYVLQLGCGMCLISMSAEILNTAYLLPSAECDFNMTSSDKGMLSAVCYIGMIVSSHLWGFMADTRGRRHTLVWTLLLDGFCALASSFSHAYWLFILLRFFNGFFICGPSAVVYAYMGVAWVIISQPWSVELPLYTYHSWRVFVVVCSLPSFITALLFLFWLPESPKFLLSQNKEEEALDVLRYMYAMNTGQQPQHYKVKSLKRELRLEEDTNYKHNLRSLTGILRLMWSQTKPLFLPPHLINTLLGCSLMFGIFASFNGFLLWLPEMFNRLADYADIHPGVSATVCEAISTLAGNITTHTEAFESNMTVINVSLSPPGTESLPLNGTCSSEVASTVFMKSLIIGGSSAIANIACVFLITRMGKKNILVTCMIVSGLSGVALLFAQSATGVLILSSILEGLTLTSPTVLNSILVDIFPTHLRAMAVCVSMLMGRVGTVVSSIILGILLEVNCILVFIALGGVLVGCGVLGFFLPSPWRWRIR